MDQLAPDDSDTPWSVAGKRNKNKKTKANCQQMKSIIVKAVIENEPKQNIHLNAPNNELMDCASESDEEMEIETTNTASSLTERNRNVKSQFFIFTMK